MENTARSKLTRETAIQAALTIITRDGASRLTIDAIARESGISKGGVLHQFRTKDAVLKALLEHQIQKGENLFNEALEKTSPDKEQSILSAQISTLRTAALHPASTTFALAGALGDSPELLASVREHEAARLKLMKEQETDFNLALMRWSAAKGLALSAIMGLSPLSEEERMHMFDYLEDDRNWVGDAPKPVLEKVPGKQRGRAPKK